MGPLNKINKITTTSKCITVQLDRGDGAGTFSSTWTSFFFASSFCILNCGTKIHTIQSYTSTKHLILHCFTLRNLNYTDTYLNLTIQFINQAEFDHYISFWQNPLNRNIYLTQRDHKLASLWCVALLPKTINIEHFLYFLCCASKTLS